MIGNHTAFLIRTPQDWVACQRYLFALGFDWIRNGVFSKVEPEAFQIYYRTNHLSLEDVNYPVWLRLEDCAGGTCNIYWNDLERPNRVQDASEPYQIIEFKRFNRTQKLQRILQ